MKVKQQQQAKQSALDQINKLLSSAKEPSAQKGKNWQEPEQVVSRPFKILHMLIIAIIFMLLGSFLSRNNAPTVEVNQPEIIEVHSDSADTVIVTEQPPS